MTASFLEEEINAASSAKDLGVTLDSNLTYGDHIVNWHHSACPNFVK